MSDKHTRRTGGFTMTELLATIAILAIVSALAFVSIAQYMRAAYQNEMDETAKEIYIAAQNHLTVADSLGTLAKKTSGAADSTTGDADAYYFVVPADKADLSNSKSMLATMLPQGSIDDTVRMSGSYIIRYQYNGAAARVLDVFYANPADGRFLQGGYSYTLTDGDFATLFSQSVYRDTGNAGKEARADYAGGRIVGYYGGEDAAGSADALPVPQLQIYNGEVLAARLTNPHAFANGVRFEFYAIGETSGAISKPVSAEAKDVVTRDGKPVIEVVFDSVTQPGHHFADLESQNDNAFIPGENVKIQVYALDTASTKVSRSARRTTNSLFASIGSASVADIIDAFNGLFSGGPLSTQATVGSGLLGSRIAKIANVRHLENLSQAISAYNPADGKLGAKTPTAYEQTVNLSWPDFCEKVVQIEGGAATAVQVHPMEGEATQAHTFMPIDWQSGSLTYQGNGRSITGVEVSAAGNAGLFGTLNGGSISNLELVNFAIATTDGDAGTLAGAATNATFANVFAHDETDSTAYGVNGTGNVGGLVGTMAGGTMTGCAAAEYVSGGTAGGLVGAASDATLRYSYAGGHTAGGKYEGDRYASNVSGGTAGGLAGTLSGEATGCYSTCSVAGADGSTGAFAGVLGATATNCYAVGAVNGVDWGVIDLYGNALSPSAYDALVAGGKNAAVPYDATLTTTYGGKYPFKTIAEIAGAADALGLASASDTTLVKHLNAHYGDWPAIVTLVVNN